MAEAEEPFIKEHGEDDHELASSSTALSNTCKAIIGSGCIALSDAFRQSGWVVGVVGLLGMAFISELTMRQLVMCNQAVRQQKREDRKRKGIESSAHDEECTFTDIGSIAYGKWGAGAADFTMLTCQFGACCAALAFIATNLGDVIDGTDRTRLMVLIPASFIALALTLLRSTAMLEHTSGLGNAIFLISIVMVVYIGSAGNGSRDCIAFQGWPTELIVNCTHHPTTPDCPALVSDGRDCPAKNYDLTSGKYNPPLPGDGATPRVSGRVTAADITGFSQFFGVALYMFSAHSEVMAIEQFVADKPNFPKVLRKAVCIACVVYLFFGLFGYFTWGDATGYADRGDSIGTHIGDIFQNIGNSKLANAVKALMCFMIMCNYPLMAFGAVQDLEHHFLPNDKATIGSWVGGKRLVLRTVWVVASALVVIATNFKFAFLVAFTGNFSNCIMAFSLPPIFYLELYPEEKDDKIKFYGNWALSISTGIIAIVFTILGVMAL